MTVSANAVSTLTITGDSVQDTHATSPLFKANASLRGAYCVVYSPNALNQGDQIKMSDLTEVFGAAALVVAYKIFERDAAFTNRVQGAVTVAPASSPSHNTGGNIFESRVFDYKAFRL